MENESEQKRECLKENTEKYYLFFFIPIKKEITKINKGSNEGVVTISISYKIKGFMVTSLLSLADNLTEGIHKS